LRQTKEAAWMIGVVSEHPTQTRLPVGGMRDAWRAAALAYRTVRQQGASDQPAWLAAREAIRKVRPELDDVSAGAQAAEAILYASVHHPGSLRPCQTMRPLSRTAASAMDRI
jgi:hypothetical protein